MQAKRCADVAKPGPPEKASLANPHRVKLTLKIAAPEFQKAAQLRKVWGNVKPLPDEALQQIRMIRKMIDDLCGRQSIIAQYLLVFAHLRALVRFALPGQTSMRDRSLGYNKKMNYNK
jgi:hypothetical protein